MSFVWARASADAVLTGAGDFLTMRGSEWVRNKLFGEGAIRTDSAAAYVGAGGGFVIGGGVQAVRAIPSAVRALPSVVRALPGAIRAAPGTIRAVGQGVANFLLRHVGIPGMAAGGMGGVNGVQVARGIAGLQVVRNGAEISVTVAGDAGALAAVVLEDGALVATDLFRGGLPAGSGSKLLAAALEAGGARSGQTLVLENIVNAETMSAFHSGLAATNSLIGGVAAKALGQLGLKVGTVEWQMADTLNIIIKVQ